MGLLSKAKDAAGKGVAISTLGLVNGSSLDGTSGNQRVSTMTAGQKALMNKYLSALSGGVGINVDTLQGYAESGYNPYDEVGGDAAVAEMQSAINRDRQRELDAIKGSHLNRFSTASRAMANDINDKYGRQVTDLNYKNLLTKAGFGQQAYGNQVNAINSLFAQSNGMLGQSAFQNQQTYNPGFLDRLGQAAGITSALGSAYKSTIGGS